MKHWSGQLFPLTVLGLLAALTFWLDSVITAGQPREKRPPDHTPDAIAENFEIRRFDENGQVKYRLSAPYLVHYGDDDSSEISAPRLVTYRPDAPPVTLIARRGHVSAKGETVQLTDDVVITREATADRAELVARTPALTIQPDAGLAFTASPVRITQGNSWVEGVGARIDQNASTFELQSQVRGHYVRARAQP